jgi:uncharacterized Rossmann fold enzyme
MSQPQIIKASEKLNVSYCLHGSVRVMAENGNKSIKQLVDSGYDGKVLSLNGDGQFVWNKVIFRSGRLNVSEKSWITLETFKACRSKLICTDDHECAALDDVFLEGSSIRFLPARDLANRFCLKLPVKSGNVINPLYNQDQVAVLLGTSVGDGYINSNGQFSVGHGHKQFEYINLKQTILGGRIKKKRPSGFTKQPSYSLSCPINAQTRELRELLYPGGTKTVKNILKYLDARSLAFWYMDDGCIAKKTKNRHGNPTTSATHAFAKLHNQGFTKRDNQLIVDWLKITWGIKSSVTRMFDRGREGFIITLSNEGAHLLFELVAPYVPACMEYKLPQELRGGRKHRWNTTSLAYGAERVTEVRPYDDPRRRSKLYDIGVARNHNFVANGTVVSNCVPLWLRDEQIRVNCATVKGRIAPAYELRTEPIAIACFGPSLADTWEKLRDFKHIITCSGAHRFLIDRGIIPTYHTEVDPRAHKIKLLGEPHQDVEYLIASTCHPDYFKHLDGYNVKLWHVFDPGEDAMRVLPAREWALTGGCGAGLRAMTLARFLGFREQHIFGMDGSEGATGKHAAAHPNQAPAHNLVEYPEGSGTLYKTISSFLEAARQTWHELNEMPDVTARFYGDGLVQAMAKDYKRQPPKSANIAFSKPELISDEMRELNARLHRDNLAYGVGGGKHAGTVLKLADSIKTTSVLDYASGKGYLAKAIPFPIWEYDPAIPGKQESPRPADLVVCTDVLEHVELDKLSFRAQRSSALHAQGGLLRHPHRPGREDLCGRPQHPPDPEGPGVVERQAQEVLQDRSNL